MNLKKYTSALALAVGCAAILTGFYPDCALAFDPTRTIEEVSKKSTDEDVVKVTTSKIVIVDYDLLRKDFKALEQMSDPEIDSWLLDQTSFISLPQANQKTANTQIAADAERQITAHRPPDYGRALVFDAFDPHSVGLKIGLLDAKGVGAKSSPRAGGHTDGLATLGECIREYSYEKLVKKVMNHSGSGVETVGTYAVIDFGFDVIHSDGSRSPAGYVLRQAHVRSKGYMSLLSDIDSQAIERVLRRYGITSAGAYRNEMSFDKINLQGTSNRALLDFGGYLVVRDFENRPAQHFFNGTELISPGTETWVEPISDLRVPFEVWGGSVSGVNDPKLDNPWLWSHELAKNFRAGRANRDDVWNHFQNLIRPVENRLVSDANCSNTLRGLLRR